MKNFFIFTLTFLILFCFISAQKVSEFKKASLKGSKTSLLLQNNIADNEGLTRIIDSVQLEQFIITKLLVRIKEYNNVSVDSMLYDKYRYVRPHTARFLDSIGNAYYDRFNECLKVNSAVRTIERQKELCKINQNAAPATGPTSSSHMTGATIDITHKDMNQEQKQWVRDYLLHLEANNFIEATEENSQAVFHIMVFKNYK
jgi:hypothetical protein